MKKFASLFAFTAMLAIGFTSAFAADKDAAKEETIKGTAKCAKCSLKEAKECQAVVVAKDGDKDVKYYVTGKEAKALHKDICTEDKENVSVTGKVTEKDGKKMIAATKVEEEKKK